MKIKYAWIPFVLTVLAAVPFRVYQLLYLVDLKTGFSKEGDISGTVFLGAIAVALLLICIMCLCDRNAPYKNVPHRNILAGIFGILLSLAMFYVSASELMNFGTAGVKAIVSGVFCALAAVSMLAMSVGMTYGKNVYENMPLLALLIPIWGCVRLVITFMNYTSIANISQHLFNMLAIIFLLLFQYSQAKMLAGVGGQKIIRSLFLFGFPAVVFAVLASVPWFVLYFSGVQAGVYEETPLTLGYSAVDCLFALFILCFLIGVYAKTVKPGVPSDKRPHPVKQEAVKAEPPAAVNFDGMNEDLQKEFFLFGEKKPEEEADDDSNEPLYFNSLVTNNEPQAAKESEQAPAEKLEEKIVDNLEAEPEEPPVLQEAEIKPKEAEVLSEPAAEQPIEEAVMQTEPENTTPAPEPAGAEAQQASPQGAAPAFAYPAAPPYPYAAYPYPPAYPYGYPPAQPMPMAQPYPASTPEEYAAYLQTVYQTPEQFTNRAPSPYPPDAPYLKNRQQPGAPHPPYPYYPYPPYPYMPMYQPYWPAPEQPAPPHNGAEQK